MAKTVASRKQKGRHLQQLIVELILKAFPALTVNDVRSVPASVPGTDIWLSEAAKTLLGIDDFEMKNQEKLNIWACLKQIEDRCTSTHVALIFKRNHSKVWATIPVEFLMELIQRKPNATN